MENLRHLLSGLAGQVAGRGGQGELSFHVGGGLEGRVERMGGGEGRGAEV